MRAGLLTELIDIYSPTYEVNEFGEKIQTYGLTYTTRARVEHNGGSRTNDNNEIFFDYSKTFTVRSYVPITESDQIEFEGKRYRVLSIENRRRDYNDKLVITELINQ
jgi:hypothetical protein